VSDKDIFIGRAADARAEADAATLQNVKDRCLRAAAAWDEMAGRIERTERMRAQRLVDTEKALQ